MAGSIQIQKTSEMKKANLIAAFLVAGPIIYTSIIWAEIPAIVPLHYGIDGKVDRMGPKAQLLLPVFVLSLVNALVYVLLCNTHRIKTGLDATPNKHRMQQMGLGICLFLTVIQLWIIYHVKLASAQLSIKFVLAMSGLLFSLVGNYMYTIKPNPFAGFRVPWAMRDATNWRQTHHFASRLWFGGGLLCAFMGLVLSMKGTILFFGIALLVMLVLPALYSYRLHKRSGA
jgi:uncharacterized membrane protein